MLLNDFFTYQIVEKSDDKTIASIEFNKEHDIYKGHFPGLPITPGVCQVQMVQEILSDSLAKKYHLKSARDIKFLNFIDPAKVDSLQLELSLSSINDSTIAVNVLLLKNEINYLKMRSVFATE